MRDLRTNLFTRLVLSLFFILASVPTFARPEDPDGKKPDAGHPYQPTVVAASPEASIAMKAFKVPQGFALDLWAAEPLLANPVVFSFDEKGNAYVVETFRLHHGVTDTRGHMNWLDDDLASRTIDDRVAKYKKFLGKDFASYGVEHDRVRLVEDRDGDGKADHAEVFADGFNNIPDGLAAGVLIRKGDVYFSCIPDLWLLKDTNGDGKADVKKSLHYGYGVHTGFLGHDLHGLIFGPDGKLYFSIGDRGLNVKTTQKHLFLPDTGAVLRCNPDGSDLEFFATGLRNPQELAFDEFGNLFTVDNNSDSGDQARIVYLIEGSESGWTMGWQYIDWPTLRGVWNTEKLWHPQWEGQSASIIPPLANFSDGPSGLAYDPGAALIPDRLKHHFFLADFRGASNGSGVRAFKLIPKGAGFQLGDNEKLLWNILATDVAFAPDGALAVSDWVEGWDLTGKGRIYKLADKSSANVLVAAEVKTHLAEGFDKRSDEDLAKLLAHQDQRVRQGAQFALADRGAMSITTLRTVAESGQGTLARIHAIWGLGQVGRKAPQALDSLVGLLKDNDPEVRAQAAKTIGDTRDESAAKHLIALLDDASPRVRSLAAIAVGKLGLKEAIAPLLRLLKDNADKDPFLRHSAVVGLVGSGTSAELLDAAKDKSTSERLGLLLALRRQSSPDVAKFLDDGDPVIVTEAARAIYDSVIDAALPALAALADRSGLTEPTLRRVVNANFRLGSANNAKTLAALASKTGLPETVRVEALKSLSDWAKPSGRDRLTGLWRPIEPHNPAEAADALEPIFGGLLKDKSDAVRESTLASIGRLPLKGVGPELFGVLTDPDRSGETKVDALEALDRSNDPKLSDAVDIALHSHESVVRAAGQGLLAKLEPKKAIPVLEKVLEAGRQNEKQAALDTLGTMPEGTADDLLAKSLDQLANGKLAPELELNLREAAGRRTSEAVKTKLAAIDATRSGDKSDLLAIYRPALVGGDAKRGERILKEKADVACLRCHKVSGNGGEVGPELTGIGSRHDRQYLLESIVKPNDKIAENFETLIVATNDGQVQSGILKKQDDKTLTIITAEAKLVTIAKADIEEKKRGASAMPADIITHLSKSEVRDIVEYLASLKDPAKK